MPCIIIEGPDGAGKSTLAAALGDLWINDYGKRPSTAHLLHRGPSQLSSLDDYQLPLQEYDLYSDLVVCDRWHLGEEVYGPRLRGGSKTTEAEFRHLELYLRARGAVQVILDTSPEELKRRLIKRGDEDAKLTIDDLADLQRRYTAAEDKTQLPSLTFFGDGTWPVEKSAAQAMLFWSSQGPRHHDFKTLIGQPHQPRLLLLGDVKSDLAHGLEAAFVPRPGSIGSWLLPQIPTDQLQGVALANANEEDVRALVDFVNPSRVVALGNNATNACRRARVQCESKFHPQYVRRFHHDAFETYAKDLFK